jgi:hypothetical protein
VAAFITPHASRSGEQPRSQRFPPMACAGGMRSAASFAPSISSPVANGVANPPAATSASMITSQGHPQAP